MAGASRILHGVGVSPGVAIGFAQVITRHSLIPEARFVENPEAELQRLSRAIEQTVGKLERVAERAVASIGADEASIFSAHAMMLSDPVLLEGAGASILKHKLCAERAFADEIERFATVLASAEDPYMRNRVVDLRDICRQVVGRLLGEQYDLDEQRPVALVAEELYPSDTVAIDRCRLLAVVSRLGSEMSHTAIMARSIEIPAVVGIEKLDCIQPGVTLIVDGTQGIVIVDPTENEYERFRKQQAKDQAERQRWASFQGSRIVTANGREIDILANIGDESDVAAALAAGAEGVGLFRTEFLYMKGPGLPNEDKQTAQYENVLRQMGVRQVVIRTLDIGGDKHVPGLTLPRETNPFLGCRAIRLCLENPDLFRVQLRAIFRASVIGNPQLLLPMITAIEELDAVKSLIADVQAELKGNGIAFRKIPIGVMVEVPAAALIADELAARVDFLSIGTNDLIQYTLAADRLNERVSYLRKKTHPAIIRLIKMIIEGAHLYGKPVSVCGEMAADPAMAVELVRLGVDKLSMASSAIGAVKAALLHAKPH